MLVNGYALERLADGVEIAWWSSLPARIEIKEAQLVLFGARADFNDGAYRIVAREREAADPVAPVPATVSDRQFAHALKNAGVITHAEAMAFVQTGTIPAALQAMIDAIEDQQRREDTELLLAGATVFERGHPMTEALRVGMGKTAAEVDDLWRAAAAL